MNSILN